VELRHLRYFVAVAEEGSFLGAASRLRVAQPALSKQIHDLEHEVGVKLFERRPRGTRVTPAGEAFLRHAREALESAARAVATARKTASATGLTLALGDVYVYTPVMLKLLAAFRHEWPDTPVRVVRVHDADQAAALREHRIDLGATFVGTWPVPGLDAVQLADCTVTGVLLPSNHPITAQERIHLRDLHDLLWLHPSPRTRPDVYRALRSGLESRGLVPARHLGRRGDIAANVAIAGGDAWALANPAVAAVYADLEGSIVYRPFVDPPIPLWYVLVWRNDFGSPLIEQLVEVARRLAPPAAAAAAVPSLATPARGPRPPAAAPSHSPASPERSP
jgi:LysR family hca operon transcriptional activator